MKHLSVLLLPLFVFTLGCSGKQKRICNQNAAYQHGYQAAQKGDPRENASTYQGGICQEFEAYSPSLYRNDFKAGYKKGKQQYCSETNYKKWGQQDGQQGKSSYPNNYSVDMKICLQDSEYKKQADKVYRASFKESFCSEERLAQVGTQQAKNFTPLKLPKIKKTCGKATTQLLAAVKKSYREQMKTNCTPAFWMLKGEEDAVAKKSKSSELLKVQKCPSSKRVTLMNQYSKSYNERKALLIEEEKLALEKKRQQEMFELEKKKQQQQYELEKERNQIERERLQSQSPSIYRPHVFFHSGKKIQVHCMMNNQNRESQVYVRNLSNSYVSVTGTWRIRYYDGRRRLLKTNDEYEHLGLSAHEEEIFKDRFAPWEAQSCVARLN